MNPYDTQAAEDLLKIKAAKLFYLCFELASDPSADEIISELEERVLFQKSKLRGLCKF